jgi:hypothetical protein
VLDQRCEIGTQCLNGVGRLAGPAQPVPAHVVAEDGVVPREPHDDVAPDAEVRPERIGKDDARRARLCRDHLIVRRDAIEPRELQDNPSAPIVHVSFGSVK